MIHTVLENKKTRQERVLLFDDLNFKCAREESNRFWISFRKQKNPAGAGFAF
jgi:hypothetical protein